IVFLCTNNSQNYKSIEAQVVSISKNSYPAGKNNYGLVREVSLPTVTYFYEGQSFTQSLSAPIDFTTVGNKVNLYIDPNHPENILTPSQLPGSDNNRFFGFAILCLGVLIFIVEGFDIRRKYLSNREAHK
ncbi:MAG TPA: hypothetical protein VN132_16810, partial [Bdellovibrio sp.]|nr:hypothetical protein [Bdellovibrio sp.]